MPLPAPAEDPQQMACAHFLNLLLYFVIAYPKIAELYPAQRFNFFMAVGIVYLAGAFISARRLSNTLFVSNILAAVSMLTLAVPLKCLPYHTSVVWCAEAAFLLAVGCAFERRVFRWLSAVISVVLCAKYLFFRCGSAGAVPVFGQQIAWLKFLSAWELLGAGACFFIHRRWQMKQMTAEEQPLTAGFAALAVIYLTFFLWLVTPRPGVTLVISLKRLRWGGGFFRGVVVSAVVCGGNHGDCRRAFLLD